MGSSMAICCRWNFASSGLRNLGLCFYSSSINRIIRNLQGIRQCQRHRHCCLVPVYLDFVRLGSPISNGQGHDHHQIHLFIFDSIMVSPQYDRPLLLDSVPCRTTRHDLNDGYPILAIANTRNPRPSTASRRQCKWNINVNDYHSLRHLVLMDDCLLHVITC